MASFHPSSDCSSELQLLSNGNYCVMVTSTGAGYSRWKNLAVTRWREDATCDNCAAFCYIRDLSSGDYWSATHQPTRRLTDRDVAYEAGRVSFHRRDRDIHRPHHRSRSRGRCAHRGHRGQRLERLVCRAPFSGTEDIFKIYAESLTEAQAIVDAAIRQP